MSTSLALPPFSDDQLAPIRNLLTRASPEQRHWLGGYIAGFQAGAEARTAPGPAATPKAKLTILYASESGNAEALAAAARKSAQRAGFAVKVLDMADTTPAEIAGPGPMLVIAATWGEGDPPQRAEAFYRGLMAEDAPRLEGLRYAVLALGDRAYAKFCETGRQFDERFSALGATRIAERVDCDLDYKKPANAWIGTVLRTLAEQEPPDHGAVIHVDFARPVVAGESDAEGEAAAEAGITALVNLNSSRSDTETWHVELSLAGSGLSYQPGDAIGFTPENNPALVEAVLRAGGIAGDDRLYDELLRAQDITTLTAPQIRTYASLTGDPTIQKLADDPGNFLQERQLIDLLETAPHQLQPEQLLSVLRPLPPRLYSVASSQSAVGEEAHLLISRVQWESHGRKRKGVASNFVPERRGVGTALQVHVKPNPRFRLPADPAAPVIMIGPGTGVAPFRGFMQEREAAGAAGRNWLFFGARRFTHDFLYQLEWQDWLASGVLSRIDLAFSRDQNQKIYVQHRMWEARGELYAWLSDGAFLYVCGDVKAMAKDVHATLLAIIADQSGKGQDDAAAELQAMQRAGRYLRDVY